MRRPITCSILSLALAAAGCALPKAPAERIVRVKALADQDLREKDPRWRESVRGVLEAASDYFEREFSIRFAVTTVEPWTAQARTPFTAALLAELKRTLPLGELRREHDLVVAFTGQPVHVLSGRARVDRIGNCEEGLANYVVASLGGPFRYAGPYSEPNLDLLALIHELAHVFGAEHVEDPSSLMHDPFDYRTELDRRNRRVIESNKFCPFAR